MGARPGLDFIRRKWLHVIINDDFLEEGECYDRALLPSIICLGRLRIASKYIFNLWQVRQGVGSLAQWLESWIFNREDWVRFPGKTEYFFSYASFLCYGFHVVRAYILDYCLSLSIVFHPAFSCSSHFSETAGPIFIQYLFGWGKWGWEGQALALDTCKRGFKIYISVFFCILYNK